MFSSVVFLLYIIQESNIENICVFCTFSPSQLLILASSRFLLLISNLFTNVKFYEAEIKNGVKSLFSVKCMQFGENLAILLCFPSPNQTIFISFKCLTILDFSKFQNASFI